MFDTSKRTPPNSPTRAKGIPKPQITNNPAKQSSTLASSTSLFGQASEIQEVVNPNQKNTTISSKDISPVLRTKLVSEINSFDISKLKQTKQIENQNKVNSQRAKSPAFSASVLASVPAMVATSTYLEFFTNLAIQPALIDTAVVGIVTGTLVYIGVKVIDNKKSTTSELPPNNITKK